MRIEKTYEYVASQEGLDDVFSGLNNQRQNLELILGQTWMNFRLLPSDNVLHVNEYYFFRLCTLNLIKENFFLDFHLNKVSIEN